MGTPAVLQSSTQSGSKASPGPEVPISLSEAQAAKSASVSSNASGDDRINTSLSSQQMTSVPASFSAMAMARGLLMKLNQSYGCGVEERR